MTATGGPPPCWTSHASGASMSASVVPDCGVAVHVGDRVRLTGVVQPPEVGEELIRRQRCRVAEVVRLREGDCRIPSVLAHRIGNRKSARELHELHPKSGEAPAHSRPDADVRAAHGTTLGGGAKTDDELAGKVLGLRRRKVQVGLETPRPGRVARARSCRSEDEQRRGQDERSVFQDRDPFSDDSCQPDSNGLRTPPPKGR